MVRSNSASARHLEQELAHRRGGVERLLLQVEVHATGFQVLDRAKQVDKGSTQAIDGPHHHDIELPAAGIL
jgi:hypothetical protein